MSEDESFSDIQDSEDEDVDDNKHASLLKALDAMDGKKRPVELRTEAYGVSEYHIPSSKDEVQLHDLVGALQKSTSHGTLKKQLQRVKQKDKALPVPLPKHEQAKIHRSLAYENTTKDLSKWDAVVHSNRNAEQLKFPLQQADLRMLTTPGQLVKRSQPRTSLELEVAALLQGSDSVLEADKILTPAEEKALQAMSLEEAKERRAELQKYRALLSYKEAKARRQKKIKSKRFHRILQKEKKKQEKKANDELEKNDPEAYLEKLKRLDEDRIEERISLKHRGGSKFAQKQALYKKYDGQTREAFQDMLQKSRQLTKKVALESDSDEGEEDGDKTANQGVDSLEISNQSSNPWMTSGIKIPKKLTKPQAVQSNITQTDSSDDNDEDDSESDDDSQSKRKRQNVDIDTLFDKLEEREVDTVRQIRRKETKTPNSLPHEEDSDDDENVVALESDEDTNTKKSSLRDSSLVADENAGHKTMSMSLKRKKTLEDFEGDFDSEQDDSEDETPAKKPALDSNSLSSSSSRKKDSDALEKRLEASKESELIVDPKKFMTIGGRSQQVLDAETDSDEEEAEDDQSMTIAKAFAEDDVIEEFQQEKAEITERDKPKDIDLTLPGWGDWGGAGVQVSKRKKKRFLIKAPPSRPRRDRNLDNVIISEVKDRTVSKHQVRSIPFPFSNPHQFESSIRQPVGKTWNPETAYKKLIKPKKVTRLGTVITPMSKEEVFNKQKRKGDIDLDEKQPKRKRKRTKK